MEETKKKSSVLSKITMVLLSLLLVASLLVIGWVIFHDNYYKTFWVNGQSMYPTLNHDASYQNGELIGEKDAHQSITTYKNLDYGIMDTHQKTIDNLKRFDIVVCYYGENETDYKIKRLIVMPGETFYISKDDAHPESNGNLYILNPETDEFDLIPQPLDDHFVHDGLYTATYADRENPTTLSDDEVFVMGDNRIGNHSNDSRKVGPIKYSSIEGKAVALEGTCEIKVDEKGNYKPINIKKHWPRYL
ncbi:MAG: signal peptidase I [Bacilli bacterium]|nr:signal peptidase I [Bacilli bacterium]